MSSEIQCTALNNAIKAKGYRFPTKPGIRIDLITYSLGYSLPQIAQNVGFSEQRVRDSSFESL